MPCRAVLLVVALLTAWMPGASSQTPAGSTAVSLRDVAASSGIEFAYQHSPTAEKHYIESAPGGLAVFDYNGDGRPDIFFTNGAQSPSLEKPL